MRRLAIFLAVFLALPTVLLARDDGRWAGSPNKTWFDSLKSGRGPCCSDADGSAVSDPDWDTIGNHYRVKIEGVWYEVPDDAVVTEPNRVGVAMVWPVRNYNYGMSPVLSVTIRCFMPGARS